MAAHLFVDNSNMFHGARRAAETLEPGAVWLSVRVYYPNLFRLIAGTHTVQTRVMAGSVPPGNDELWDMARKAGYETDLLKKVEKDDGHLGEQAVDEMLHLKIANVLLDFEPPQTLILATGDGRLGQFRTSFPLQAERALKRGWYVEVWSWKDQVSGNFARISPQQGVSIRVQELDPYYRMITFIKGGTYTLGSTSVSVQSRVVAKFTKPA